MIRETSGQSAAPLLVEANRITTSHLNSLSSTDCWIGKTKAKHSNDRIQN